MYRIIDVCDGYDVQEQLVDELQRSLLESRRESQDLARALAQCQEDCMQIRSEVDMEQEVRYYTMIVMCFQVIDLYCLCDSFKVMTVLHKRK